MACVFWGVMAILPNSNETGSSSADPDLRKSKDSASASDVAESSDNDLELHPLLKDRRYDAAIRSIVEREDPELDGWDTEQFTELADGQFKKIGHLLANSSSIIREQVKTICTADFAGLLRPSQLELAYQDDQFTVHRQLPEAAAARVTGLDGLASAMNAQAAVFAAAQTKRFKFKTIRVELDGDVAKTKSYFQMTGLGPRVNTQVTSTWDCRWRLTGNAPLLTEILVAQYEEVAADANRTFVDCTRSLFEGIEALDAQLVYGRDHWYGNLEASIGVEGRGNGIAIGDANGDGWDDVYICQPAALPNRLMIRQADGSLRDTSSWAGVDWLDSSRGALFVDLDNDGDQDLVITQQSNVLVHENDGTGKFELRETVQTDSRLFSLNALDYDNDKDLDLYVCGYSQASQARPEDIFASPVPYHDANNGAPNILLRNEGSWSFVNVTRAVGLDDHNLRFSLASAWEDFDNDGDQDLYVANDFGRNNLYRNHQGQFKDIAAEAGVEDIGPGMSAAWGDYNNDGQIDLYVSNMFSSAGSRITHNARFKREASLDDLAGFQRHARGNTLFENRGDGAFEDRGLESGTMMGRWAWGSLFTDVNNDGWQDVYVTNGFVTADDNNDL